MSSNRGTEAIEAGDIALAEAYDEPMSLAAYVETLFEHPARVADAANYLLAAIEAAGTRTTVEAGERKERYRFFDDPHSNGEHAVLGNTETLNAFVDDLRSIAAGQGKREKIVWFAGPTATGKSELKRCLINGLREYSKTSAGRRYTIEWSLAGATADRGLSYGDERGNVDEDWHQSPVQTPPLSVFPQSIQRELIDDLTAATDGPMTLRVPLTLDPFSRTAYEYLTDQYRDSDVTDLFSTVTAPEHFRVTNYVMDLGRGIGVLHAEDDGSATERLVGTWMPSLLQELDSQGRKDPRAFSYDGVLAQGNAGVTIIEDAAQHADVLRKLLNVPDEGRVKLDTGIEFELDTQLIVISNPDLEATLNQHADQATADPLKALKRRLNRHEFGYLTTLSLEVQLLRRELTDETAVWTATDYDTLEDRIRAAVTVPVNTADRTLTRELAPHSVEAAALYDVVSRLSEDDLPADLDLIDKALLFDKGYITDGDTRTWMADLEVSATTDGHRGIPVTYTRDVIAELLQSERDRSHPEYDVGDVIMPEDVLDAMVEGLAGAPVFSPGERSTFDDRVAAVKAYIFDRQEQDVLDAITYNQTVDPDLVEDYVEHVYAWGTEEPLENDRGERIEPDPLQMKIFEIEHLGQFTESDYDGQRPRGVVEQFRQERVITALNRHAWRQRGDDFAVGDVDLTDLPVIQSVLAATDWDDIKRQYPDFDPEQWADPPVDTETARLKTQTIETLTTHFGYSPASAELTSRRVLREVQYKWD